MKRQILKAALLAGAITLAGAASAQQNEVSELKMMSQFGIGYMQFTVIKAEKLIEKHLARAGLPGTKVTWATLGAGAAANDALLSGSLHVAAGGTGPAFILWDRTRGNMDVRGIAALSSMPNLLVTRNPNIKTIKDFTEKDRIAMAGAGSSVQTIYLQMAVAKEFGQDNFRRLNPLMVNLPHPEGLRAMLSGQGEPQSQFTSPPFQNQALEAGARVVLNSYDIMGGPNTFLMVWTTSKFRSENPRTYKAVLDALREATDFINANKRRAAEMYVAEGGGKENVDKILALMDDPQVRYTLAPERVLPYAQFMHQIGTLKNRPATWRDLFFQDIHDLPGS
ncbi:MAG: ABC transporter substrate-binding protein [Burkholderiales bacterium]|jgi:NitT/TauT family transport system substrate-binding protein|nr:ABC transporter substrate-binding protein [Burkholderiales bacterium]